MARSGAQTLEMLASPLNCAILQGLAEGPMQQSDLRRRAGSPAQTTLRAQLQKLAQTGAIEKHRRNRFPGVLEHELTDAGRQLIEVARVTERWLAEAPDEPLALGSPGAKAALKALIAGWSSTMLRALAARPLSLTELDGLITALNYPSLERRLAAMRLVGQIEPCPGKHNGTPYAVTGWLRHGVAPLVASVQWERRHLAGLTPPITPIDAEAAFLLALPLLRVPAELHGACRLGVEMSNGRERRLVGALAHVDHGRVPSCSVRLRGSADAWATGPVNAWLQAVIAADTSGLELGGDQRLARALVTGLNGALFGLARRDRGKTPL